MPLVKISNETADRAFSALIREQLAIQEELTKKNFSEETTLKKVAQLRSSQIAIDEIVNEMREAKKTTK